MATLDEFLNADDLDNLLKVRHGLGERTNEETERISQIVSEWRNAQATRVCFIPNFKDFVP